MTSQFNIMNVRVYIWATGSPMLRIGEQTRIAALCRSPPSSGYLDPVTDNWPFTMVRGHFGHPCRSSQVFSILVKRNKSKSYPDSKTPTSVTPKDTRSGGWKTFYVASGWLIKLAVVETRVGGLRGSGHGMHSWLNKWIKWGITDCGFDIFHGFPWHVVGCLGRGALVTVTSPERRSGPVPI